MGRYASNDPKPLSELAVIDDAIEQITSGLDIPGAVSDYLTANPPTGGLTIDQIKADTSIADAITKKHSNSNDHAPGSDNQSLLGLEVTTAKGAANGYAPLDASSKVPIGNLPDTILGSVNYHGTFIAAGGTTPTVSPVVLKGDYFVISVAGTIGADAYLPGDWIIYNGVAWERVDNSDKVSSVNGQQGVVVLTIPAAQVKSDWNASGAIAEILNKPTIPAAQVQTDWSSGSGMGQLLNKPTIPNVRLFTNLAAPIASSGTTEKILLQLAITGARASVGSTFRSWLIGLSSSTGTLIFKVRAGAAGTISDPVCWTAITSAAQAANKRAGFDALSIVRSATTLYTDGIAYAGSLQLETVIAAAAASAVTISGTWYISLTVICSSGTFTCNVATIEEIR